MDLNLILFDESINQGLLAKDTSYIPNKEDIKKEQEMKRLTIKEMLKQQKQQALLQDNLLQDELITTADKHPKIVKVQNQINEPTLDKIDDGNKSLTEDVNTKENLNSNYSEELKATFEVKLAEKLKEESAALTKKEFLNIAKELRLKMGIDDTELVLSKTWFLTFTNKQNIIVEKQPE